jgi:hypothetical protein
VAKTKNTFGGWAFLIGIVIAIVLGFFNIVSYWWTIALVIIGIIVGLFNIVDDETQPFLWSGVALIIASAFGQSAVSLVPVLARILYALLVIFVPATIVVALKNLFVFSRQ